MKTYISILLILLFCGCKKEPEKEICWDCVQKLTRFEGTKWTETKTNREICTVIAKNFYEENFTFSRDYGTYKEIAIASCTQKP